MIRVSQCFRNTEVHICTTTLMGNMVILLLFWEQEDEVQNCPGFGQDRVNFHENPGRGTAGWDDPTPSWPNRARYSIPCAVMLGSDGGGGGAGTRSRLGRSQRWCGPRERFCSAGLFCIFPLSVSLLFLFPLFAVLLNCPYPDPPVSACLFPFSSAPRQGEGQPRGAFVASCSQNQNKNSDPFTSW